MKKLGVVERTVQDLIVPITIECSLEEYLFLEENKSVFEEIGIFLEEFGHQTFVIKSHPVWFPKGKEQETIDEIIQHVKEKGK